MAISYFQFFCFLASKFLNNIFFLNKFYKIYPFLNFQTTERYNMLTDLFYTQTKNEDDTLIFDNQMIQKKTTKIIRQHFKIYLLGVIKYLQTWKYHHSIQHENLHRIDTFKAPRNNLKFDLTWPHMTWHWPEISWKPCYWITRCSSLKYKSKMVHKRCVTRFLFLIFCIMPINDLTWPWPWHSYAYSGTPLCTSVI